ALDDLGDQLGQRAEFEGKLQIARRLLRDDIEGLRQLRQVASKNRAQYDLERQLAHFLGYVQRLAAHRVTVPPLGKPTVHIDPDLRKLRHDAPVKKRLHHVPLPPPQIALAGHDSLAEQNLDAVETEALGIVAMIGDENALDVIRMVNDVR